MGISALQYSNHCLDRASLPEKARIPGPTRAVPTLNPLRQPSVNQGAVMNALLRLLNIRDWATVEGPALVAAWIIAEFFYKFHSFTLECGAFLATWLVLGSVLRLVVKPRDARRVRAESSA
jgi:hypothetical protein